MHDYAVVNTTPNYKLEKFCQLMYGISISTSPRGARAGLTSPILCVWTECVQSIVREKKKFLKSTYLWQDIKVTTW